MSVRVCVCDCLVYEISGGTEIVEHTYISM